MTSATGPILYRARFVLPICSAPIENGALLVDDRHILDVDTFDNLSVSHPDVAIVDFGETILLPPMVNAHTHLELSSFSEWAAAAGIQDAPQDFVDWILWLVRVRRSLSDEQLHDSLVGGLNACLLAGTGAVGDIFTTLSAAPAYRKSPLRGRIFAEVLGHDPAVVEERLTAISDIILKNSRLQLDWGLSPHAPYTLSAEVLDKVFAYAEWLSLQCTTHLAESRDETRFLLDGSGPIADKLYASAKWDAMASQPPGCSPVAALCRQGRLRAGDLVVHGVQVDVEDVDLLKRSGCSVVLCPRSNATLNVGKAPVAAYLEAGIPLALGTDSLASSQSLSIWDEMAFALDWFSDEAQASDWLEIATLGGAKALGLQEKMGQLSPGLEASFQVVKLAELPSVDTLEKVLCSAGQEIIVTHLYLAAENVLLES